MMPGEMKTRGEYIGRRVLLHYRELMEFSLEPDRSVLETLLEDLAEYVGSDVFEPAATKALRDARSKEEEKPKEPHPF